ESQSSSTDETSLPLDRHPALEVHGDRTSVKRRTHDNRYQPDCCCRVIERAPVCLKSRCRAGDAPRPSLSLQGETLRRRSPWRFARAMTRCNWNTSPHRQAASDENAVPALRGDLVTWAGAFRKPSPIWTTERRASFSTGRDDCPTHQRTP